MKIPALVLAISSLLFCIPAYQGSYQEGRKQSSQDDIVLETVRLRIGMSEEPVLDMLPKSYDLQKAGPSWMVSKSVSADSKIPPRAIGSVTFTDGKLTTVMRYWGPEDQQKGFEFAEHLYDLPNSFTNEGRTSCSIETGRLKQLEFDSRTIFITCGAKHIRMDLLTKQDGKFTDLSEVLGQK